MLTTLKNYRNESRENRELIKRFDRDFSACLHGDDGLTRIVSYLFEGLGVLFLCFPYQTLAEEKNFFMLSFSLALFFAYSSVFYLNSYLSFKEGNKPCALPKKLRYVPVNKVDFFVVRFEYLLHFKKKSLLISLFAQLLITFIAYRKISVMNILYVLLSCVLLPFLLCVLNLWGSIRASCRTR